MIKKVITVFLTVCMALGVMGCGTKLGVYILGEKENELLNYNETYGLSDGEYSLILNEAMSDSKAVQLDGKVYLDASTVIKKINSRFYWDYTENFLLYTTPTEIVKAVPDTDGYTVNDKTQSFDGKAVVMQNYKYYIALDFIKLYTKMDCNVYTNPNRVVIKTNWADQEVSKVTKKTQVLYMGGEDSPAFRTMDVDESMVVLDDGSGDVYANVVTEDGYIGWIKNECITTHETTKPIEPLFEEPVYTSISKDYPINMAWHGVYSELGNAEIDDIISNTTGINTISPRWFYFQDTNGTLVSLADKEYVQKAHDNGMEVWAMFMNEFDAFDGAKTDEVLSSTKKRAFVIEQLISKCLEVGVDGINVDFEMVTEDGAVNYIQFIRELSIQCRANKLVLSIDDHVPTYTAYYNRTEQGIVADYVVIMGYDEYNDSSSKVGPVASMGFAEQGIIDTLKEVPKEKVINAIPLYGRVWETNATGAIVDTYTIAMGEGEEYLSNHDVTAEIDPASGLNYGQYTSEADGNTYQIWLEDDTSIQTRLAMIKYYGLAGVAQWRLGYESGIETWQVIESNLNQ